ncbi:uncharacterized protein LAJ45_05648 [Morchella importuna]|uniref:uncharacterized protein n=1 Tax=Morchella importuna TaxID=1174673 RepID=UPI001E8DEFCE|nr:uncharacterized protein LAJ45_05648 [Morchella importuna]KAH8150435.1 hypothetical protein LAJ45_05648 [Morchella importuna]
MTSQISPKSILLHNELKEIIFTLAAYVTRLKDDRSKIRYLIEKMNSHLVELGFDIDNNALGGRSLRRSYMRSCKIRKGLNCAWSG